MTKGSIVPYPLLFLASNAVSGLLKAVRCASSGPNGHLGRLPPSDDDDQRSQNLNVRGTLRAASPRAANTRLTPCRLLRDPESSSPSGTLPPLMALVHPQHTENRRGRSDSWERGCHSGPLRGRSTNRCSNRPRAAPW
jgi:hypothetical protein